MSSLRAEALVVWLAIAACSKSDPPKSEPPPPSGSATDPWAGGSASAPTGDAVLQVVVPDGFVQDGSWYVRKSVENRGGGDEVTSALVSVLRDQPRTGDVANELHELWRKTMPRELTEAAGAMTYHRYVGDGIPASFTFGIAREHDHQADSLFALYLVTCGNTWTPIVVAQTYAEPNNANTSLVERSGRMSFATSARLAEPFLAALRCPGHGSGPLVDPAQLAGDYHFGSSASQEWVQLGTGASFMTAVTYGGRLALDGDGTFAYEFTGAAGKVGNMTISTDAGSGRWRVERDLLIVTFDDGKTVRYRIAGLARLATSQAAVLFSDLTRPIDPTTVTDGGAFYVTR